MDKNVVEKLARKAKTDKNLSENEIKKMVSAKFNSEFD